MSDLYKLIWDDMQDGEISLFKFRKIVAKHTDINYNTPLSLTSGDLFYMLILIAVPILFFAIIL